ncbi:MAG: hypothetical protein ACI81A_000184, partial [Paraglaciecola sp.]
GLSVALRDNFICLIWVKIVRSNFLMLLPRSKCSFYVYQLHLLQGFCGL